MTDIKKVENDIKDLFENEYSNVQVNVTSIESNGITRFDITVGVKNK